MSNVNDVVEIETNSEIEENVEVTENPGTLRKIGGHFKRNWIKYAIGAAGLVLGGYGGFKIGYNAGINASEILDIADDVAGEIVDAVVNS